MKTVKIPRFSDLNINGTKTGRVSANVIQESNTPKSSSSTVKKVSANELFGNGPIDHDAHTNCSCHPKE
jgi:hypothetical protein